MNRIGHTSAAEHELIDCIGLMMRFLVQHVSLDNAMIARQVVDHVKFADPQMYRSLLGNKLASETFNAIYEVTEERRAA